MSGRAYYETTPLTRDQRDHAFRSALNQDELVMAVFRHSGQLLTPSQVSRVCEGLGKRWPLTSIRRSISTLTRADALVKTEVTRMGTFGMPEHCWRIAERVAGV